MHLQPHQNPVNAASSFSVRIFAYSLAEKQPNVTITISSVQLRTRKRFICKSYCIDFAPCFVAVAVTTAIVQLELQITICNGFSPRAGIRASYAPPSKPLEFQGFSRFFWAIGFGWMETRTHDTPKALKLQHYILRDFSN